MGEEDQDEQARRAAFARGIREAELEDRERYRQDTLEWYVGALTTLVGIRVRGPAGKGALSILPAASRAASQRRRGWPNFKANASPVGASWMWTLAFGYHENRTPTHGYAETREAAMAAFAKS
jgi:hypothetical protein